MSLHLSNFARFLQAYGCEFGTAVLGCGPSTLTSNPRASVMENRPVPAKVTRPQLGDSFPRSRLFKWLDHARRRPLIWIMGPPGSGKTTLISDYLARRRLTTLWYQADRGDSDVATFFHYLDHAAHKAAPRFRRPLPRFTPDRLGDLDHFTREFFNELYIRLKTPFCIVLDNYHEVPEKAELHDVLCIAAENLPAGGHLVGVSRTAPPPSLARARLNERMAILDDTALRLTLDEAQGIARHRLPSRRARQQVSALHELTHGWVAGLTLMLEQSNTDLPTNAATYQTPGVLFEYFANEVFAKADSDTRTVLLRSAFLPTLTARTVAELSGERRAGRILSHLSRHNFFTNRYELPEPVYQYHPLFREFLLSRARRLPASELTALQARTAAILERHEAHESALSLYEDLSDWPGFERCLKKLAPVLISQGRHLLLEQWLTRLPEEMLAEKPWLLYYCGLSRMQHSPAAGRAFFERAHRQFRSAADQTGLLTNWIAIIDSFILEWSDFKPIRAWIDELEAILGPDPLPPARELEPQMSCARFLALMYGRPEDPGLSSWAARAEKVMRTTDNLKLRAKIAPHLLIYFTWWDGDLPKAEALINQLRLVLNARDVPAICRITWHTMAASFYWMAADSRQSQAEVQQGLELADASSKHAWDMLLCAQGVFATLFDNHADAAEPYFARMDSLHNPTREVDSAWYYYLLAGRYFFQSDLPRARQYLEQALRSCRDTAFVLGEANCLNDLARVVYYQGDHPAALDLLRAARAIGETTRNRFLEYLTGLTEAEFALIAGDESACQQALCRFLAVGRQQRFCNHSWWRSDLMARLYSRALEHRIETEYVLGIIQQRALAPPEEARESDSWPFRYKIYTLGRFTLVKDGEALTFSGKAQSKPLDLLKALIALGGRQINTTLLSELLWPDADGDAAQRAFDTTLHRLRRLLGQEQALLLSDGKLSLNSSQCWVDAWAFERLMGRLDLFLKQAHTDNTHHDTVGRLAAQLSAIYRGPFLGSDHNERWAITPRERLQNRLLCLLGALGRYWESTGEWQRAADTYHKAIDTHGQAEEYYQRLMQAYRKIGRPAEAAAVYQRCRETLLATLGRPPSSITETLYRQLANSD